MRANVVAAVGALALGGCAAVYVPRAELAAYPGTNRGMIAFDIDASSFGCLFGEVWFQREGASKSLSIFVTDGHTGVEIVEPGLYSAFYAECANGAYSYTLPNVGAWFLPFEVKQQEIVHLGTFAPVSVAVEVDRTDLEEVTNAVFTLGVSLFTNRPTRTVEFPTYEFRPPKDTNFEALKIGMGDLSETIVVRQPVRILSSKAIESAYRRAYAPKSDGTAPSDQEAEANLKVEMKAAWTASLREYVETHGDDGEPASLE